MRRPPPIPAEGKPVLLELGAQVLAHLAASRAVLAGFRQELEAGTLRASQHASLRLLEEAIVPFAMYDEPAIGSAPGNGAGQDEARA